MFLLCTLIWCSNEYVCGGLHLYSIFIYVNYTWLNRGNPCKFQVKFVKECKVMINFILFRKKLGENEIIFFLFGQAKSLGFYVLGIWINKCILAN